MASAAAAAHAAGHHGDDARGGTFGGSPQRGHWVEDEIKYLPPPNERILTGNLDRLYVFLTEASQRLYMACIAHTLARSL